MRARQAGGGVRNAEIAVCRIGTQPVGLEILVAVMADGKALRYGTPDRLIPCFLAWGGPAMVGTVKG